MSVGQIVLIFVIFCIVWLCFQITWKKIEGEMQKRQIEQLLDTVYARFVKLGLSFLSDVREVNRNVKM